MKLAAAAYAMWVGVFGLGEQLLAQVEALAGGQPTVKVGAAATDWTAAIDDAKKQFQPISTARLATARKNLDILLANFDRWLSQNKVSEAYWKPHVGWSELVAELKRDDQAHPAVIREIASRFSGQEAGFEDLHFAQVKSALNWYANFLSAAQSANNGRDWYDGRMKDLAEHLARYPQKWDPIEGDQIGLILGELQDMQESPELVARILRDFGHRNFIGGASAEFIRKVGTVPSQALPEPETEDFHDTILGTCIVGKTTTYRDSQTSRLVNSGDHISMVIDASGKVMSNTVGYHSPVTIFSTGYTPYAVSMPVTFDAFGFQHGMPTASACVHTTINGLCIDGGRLVQRIATKRVYRSKPEAEGIASEHARVRAAAKMNQKADDPDDPNSSLRVAQNNYLNKMRNPLLRWGAFPQETLFSSYQDHVAILARESNRYQLAAPSEPLAVKGSPEMWVSVHQSFINNIAAATLAGRTVSEFDSRSAYRQFMGGNKDLDEDLDRAARQKPCSDEDVAAAPAPPNPEKAQPPAGETAEEKEDRQRRRTMTFAKTRPFTVEFGDSTFTIKIRATRYSRPKADLDVGDNDNSDKEAQIELPGMDVTAEYQIEKCKDGSFQARRIKDKYIVEASQEVKDEWEQKAARGELGRLKKLRLSAIMGTSQRQAKQYFDRMFPEYMMFKGLNFDPHSPLARAGTMVASDMTTKDGWLAIGWNTAK